MSNQFNMFAWSGDIPLCDDLWLGMQARNIAMVDLGIIRGIEENALAAYMERERTPSDILLPLAALSQMWVFSLYEFLRTWRQRAGELIELSDEYWNAPLDKRPQILDEAVKKAENKEKLIRTAMTFYSEHISRVGDAAFVKALKDYWAYSEPLFRSAESLRVTLAKHEVPKTASLIAEAPGYGRMSYKDGSMYWFVTLKDDSQIQVNRRDLANFFMQIDDEEI